MGGVHLINSSGEAKKKQMFKVRRTVLLAAMSVAVLGVMGCDEFFQGRRRRDPVYLEQQSPYAQQPQYADPQYLYGEQQPQYVIVQQAPPAVIVEHRPYPPSEAYVWIDGYWNWDNQRYNWQGGRYVIPPQAGVVWIAPRYEKDTRGYRYTAGRWTKRNEDSGPDAGNGRGRGRGGN